MRAILETPLPSTPHHALGCDEKERLIMPGGKSEHSRRSFLPAAAKLLMSICDPRSDSMNVLKSNIVLSITDIWQSEAPPSGLLDFLHTVIVSFFCRYHWQEWTKGLLREQLFSDLFYLLWKLHYTGKQLKAKRWVRLLQRDWLYWDWL